MSRKKVNYHLVASFISTERIPYRIVKSSYLPTRGFILKKLMININCESLECDFEYHNERSSLHPLQGS